jgi:hypothetical protein
MLTGVLNRGISEDFDHVWHDKGFALAPFTGARWRRFAVKNAVWLFLLSQCEKIGANITIRPDGCKHFISKQLGDIARVICGMNAESISWRIGQCG